MTPKEKVKHLVWDFYNIQSNEYDYGMNWQIAKKCALIAVDEILEVIIFNKYDDKYWEEEEYWQEVKQEIFKSYGDK
jgi:hypothetical protein